MKGTIIKVNRVRGYGFIRTENGEEIFFHRTDLVMIEINQLTEGKRVEFRLDNSPRGLVEVSITLATYVRVIED